MALSRHRPTSPTRPAFTLLELMLVLTLLAVLAAFAWPALDGPMAANRLYRSGEKIRAEWRQARVDAMSSGTTRIFRFAPDENRYAIEAESECPFLSSGDTFGAGSFASQDSAAAGSVSRKERTLPGDVTFGQCQVETDTRADMYGANADSAFGGASETFSATISDSSLDAGPYSSSPILFFADGTTSTARLLLKNERGHQVEVRLRGLTGVVAVDWAESDQGGRDETKDVARRLGYPKRNWAVPLRQAAASHSCPEGAYT